MSIQASSGWHDGCWTELAEAAAVLSLAAWLRLLMRGVRDALAMTGSTVNFREMAAMVAAQRTEPGKPCRLYRPLTKPVFL
jgi:hypothetical protein